MPEPIKTYIGDSVYAEFTGYSVILTTDNGHGPSNEIVMERSELRNLVEFAKHHGLLEE